MSSEGVHVLTELPRVVPRRAVEDQEQMLVRPVPPAVPGRRRPFHLVVHRGTSRGAVTEDQVQLVQPTSSAHCDEHPTEDAPVIEPTSSTTQDQSAGITGEHQGYVPSTEDSLDVHFSERTSSTTTEDEPASSTKERNGHVSATEEDLERVFRQADETLDFIGRPRPRLPDQ